MYNYTLTVSVKGHATLVSIGPDCLDLKDLVLQPPVLGLQGQQLPVRTPAIGPDLWAESTGQGLSGPGSHIVWTEPVHRWTRRDTAPSVCCPSIGDL